MKFRQVVCALSSGALAQFGGASFGGPSFESSFETGLDAIAYNFQLPKVRTSRLQFKWNSVGMDVDNVEDWQVILKENGEKVGGRIINPKDPKENAREVRQLRPRTYYTITIRAVAGDREGQEATYEAYTSPTPIRGVSITEMSHDSVSIKWEEPNSGADMYRIHEPSTGNEQFAFGLDAKIDMEFPGETKQIELQGCTCADVNACEATACGRPYEIEITSVPPPPINVELGQLKIKDFDRADGTVQWINPSIGNWDTVKIEYSPNTPPADTETPSYISSSFAGESTQIKGLYQNTVYTFTVRFVSNNVEGPAESYTWSIPDAVTSKFPSAQTCKVPTYLKPEKLVVKRDIFGDGSMSVNWDHPRAKQPENGYRLVFAPFTEITQMKPWYEEVDGNTADFKLSGAKYDPYEEYTVSVIALHDEQIADPHSPDFIATHFTGSYIKKERNTLFVAPDACCGSERYNSKVSSCCGGTILDEADNIFCCKDITYSAGSHKCCGAGRLVPNDENC